MLDKRTNRISLRLQVSALIIGMAILALMLPDRSRSAFEMSPTQMIQLLNESQPFLSCDEVARMVVYEDTSLLLIDLRDPQEYLSSNIPGAINIPFKDIVNPDWSGYLDQEDQTTVLYSTGNIQASQAWMLCTQLGYPNIKIMDGGIQNWNLLVMESEFSGERISAAENALFQVRYRARDYFNTMNSLPDSLKTAFLETRKKKEAELVGGCE